MVWAGVFLIIATCILGFLYAAVKLRLATRKPLPVYGAIADFSLTNQDGRTITLTDLRGHPWVADIIFTRCAGPCLKMSRQMKDLQQALSPDSQARLVSLTTDADYDTPPVLKAYAARFNADPNRWMFLTGTKQQVANLAIDSLKLTAIAKKPEERQSPEDLFVHSTIFVVADKQGRLRGVYETTGDQVDPQQVKSDILSALRRLEREP